MLKGDIIIHVQKKYQFVTRTPCSSIMIALSLGKFLDSLSYMETRFFNAEEKNNRIILDNMIDNLQFD